MTEELEEVDLTVMIMKLFSGEEVVGIYIGSEAETSDHVVRFPMLIQYNKEAGSVKLDKYMPFSGDEFVGFSRASVISITEASLEFQAYYNNNVNYYNKYEEPIVRQTLTEINSAFMNLLDDSANRFLDAARELKVDLKTLAKQRAN